MSKRRPVIATILLLAATLASATVADARELTFADRVVAQRAIEQVYWSHRIWPNENPGAKPPLSAVMSDREIRARVEDYLAKSNALEKWWQRPITVAQLQAEIDRMARNSCDPQVLHELFTALGRDPFVIAETLARQNLAERLIRDWYANDTRFHGELRKAAEAAVSACASVGCMKTMGGEYHEQRWELGRDEARGDDDQSPGAVTTLDSDDWNRHLQELALTLGAAPDSIPVGRSSGLAETADGFAITAALTQAADEITTATTFWPKRSFDAWWQEERAAIAPRLAETTGRFDLPSVAGTPCLVDTWTRTRVDSVPDRRDSHAAVWTGAEMIVWGGTVRFTHDNTGGRYHPSTDTWIATSMGANVPAARSLHTAVWTGTEMIVWSGQMSGGSENTGGRYDPSTDIWTATSIGANAPGAREGHTAVWSGTEMIVWGGGVNSGGRYDPSTDSWTATSIGANTPSARDGHTAVWSGAEMIVWGGWDGIHTNTGGRYNPSTDSWTTTSTGANVPNARYRHGAVWTGKEMIVWGGFGGIALDTGGRYDPATDSWTTTSTGTNAPGPRSSHSAVWTGMEMIIWGGEYYFPNTTTYLNTGGRYNPSTDSWSATSTGANVPGPHSGHTAVWTGTEMIVWGGSGGPPGAADHFLNTGGRYNPATDNWTATSTAAGTVIPRYGHVAVWTGTEMIVWGGTRGFGPLNTGGRYDPSTDNWTATSTGANAPGSRHDHTAVWTGAEMIVWGGYGDGAVRLDTGGRYNPATDAWTVTSTGANVPAARARHSAVWSGAEMIVWGGWTAEWPLTTTGGRYNPSTDTWLATSTGANVPVGRARHTAVWTGTEMIVWGGDLNTAALNTGGRYDPRQDRWATTSTGANAPSSRRYHTAVWTGAEMIVWGGSDRDLLTNTGGRYDPTTDTWTATSTGANVAGPREHHTAVWMGAEMIVWGGDSVSRAPPVPTSTPVAATTR